MPDVFGGRRVCATERPDVSQSVLRKLSNKLSNAAAPQGTDAVKVIARTWSATDPTQGADRVSISSKWRCLTFGM